MIEVSMKRIFAKQKQKFGQKKEKEKRLMKSECFHGQT